MYWQVSIGYRLMGSGVMYNPDISTCLHPVGVVDNGHGLTSSVLHNYTLPHWNVNIDAVAVVCT